MSELEPVDRTMEAVKMVQDRRLAHWIIQSIIGEVPYSGTARDDEVWWQLHAIGEQDGLPEGHTADDLYNLYRTNYGGG